MDWNELDLTRAIWTQPSARTKNRKVHIVPLSKPAVRILEALRKRQAELKNEAKQKSRFVFHNPRNPDLALTWLQKAGERVRAESKVEDFRPHDLRRTCATRLAEMGVPDAVLKMILNHIKCATVHEAKGHEYDAVCVVIPPDQSGHQYTTELFAHWEQRTNHEAKRVIYVGVTRAKRLVALAIPKEFQGRLTSILQAADIACTVTVIEADKVKAAAPK
jgi:superfamily I DNA/RNA helicase